MKTVPLRSPSEILKAVVASESAVIRSRDSELAKSLEVEPRIIEHFASRYLPPPRPSIPRRALRKAYRVLDRVQPLRPLVQKVRFKLLERFDTKPPVVEEQDTLTTVKRSYTIAFTMRSGSNEICNLLGRNGLGSPSEFFQKPIPGEPSFVLDGFSRIVSRYQVRGIFGSKMAQEHRAGLDAQLRNAIPGYTRLDDVLPNHKWVWLSRRDKIMQAISWCRAETSNRWAARSAGEGKSSDYSYDYLHILSRVMLIHASEQGWEAYFQQNEIEPYRVVYEDFFADVGPQLARLIKYLGGLPPDYTTVDKGATFAVQRSEKSYQIRERFVSDLMRMGSHELTLEVGPSFKNWIHFMFDYGWKR